MRAEYADGESNAAAGLGHRNIFRKRDLAYATSLIREVLEVAGQNNIIEETRQSFEEIGLLEAIQRHNDDALYNWLAEAISYQGISDSVAAGYIREHGSIGAADVRAALESPYSCSKLTSFGHFEDCGYRKSKRTCNQPKHFKRCPLPRHDLRNGNLNRASYSLYLFMRDVAGGDLVGWIDDGLALADRGRDGHRAKRLRDALVIPLRDIFGVSDKLLNMSLAGLLLAGDLKRKLWIEAGAGMIAVDTLVHNWMHRSGILMRLRCEHPYGPACYGPLGCTTIIEAAAEQIDARYFNPTFPKVFPRFVQNGIWRHCAGVEFNRCNGNQIDDSGRCEDKECPIYKRCGRVALNPAPR